MSVWGWKDGRCRMYWDFIRFVSCSLLSEIDGFLKNHCHKMMLYHNDQICFKKQLAWGLRSGYYRHTPKTEYTLKNEGFEDFCLFSFPFRTLCIYSFASSLSTFWGNLIFGTGHPKKYINEHEYRQSLGWFVGSSHGFFNRRLYVLMTPPVPQALNQALVGISKPGGTTASGADTHHAVMFWDGVLPNSYSQQVYATCIIQVFLYWGCHVSCIQRMSQFWLPELSGSEAHLRFWSSCFRGEDLMEVAFFFSIFSKANKFDCFLSTITLHHSMSQKKRKSGLTGQLK